MAEKKNSRDSPNLDDLAERRSLSQPPRDFFGRPRIDSEKSATLPHNGVHNSFEPHPDSGAPAQPVQIVTRDPWLRAAVVATLLALIALAAYARDQWIATRRSVAQLQFAVGKSQQAAEQQGRALIQASRADVSLGGPGGTLAELTTDARTGASAVMLHFFNSGRTPARHFGVVAWSNARPGVPEVRYRQRFRNKETGEIVTDRMSAAEATVATESPAVTPLPDQWTPSRALLADLRAHPERLFVVSGVFEYCDAFGQYRCANFSARYLSEPANRFVSWLTTACRPPWPAPPPGGTDMGKPIRWVQLERCEQPGEPE